MAPFVDLSRRQVARGVSMASSDRKVPSWTIGDDSDDKAKHDEAKRKLDKFRSRARKRRQAAAAAVTNNDGGTSRPPAHRFVKRGRLGDVAGPNVVGITKRGKGGEETSERGWSSESGHESEKEKGTLPQAGRGSPPTSVDGPPPLAPPPPLSLVVASSTASPAEYTAPPSPLTSPAKAPKKVAANPIDPAIPTAAPSLTAADDDNLYHSVAPTGLSSTSLASIGTVTSPGPARSSGARKEVEAPATETPVIIVMESATPVSTPSSDYTGGINGAKGHRHGHDDDHGPDRPGKALIAMGSIGIVIVVFFSFWMAWKFLKARRRRRSGGAQNGSWPRLPASLSLDKAKQLVARVASRIPALTKRRANRRWTNMDRPHDEAFWEKRLSGSKVPEEKARGGITVHTAFSRNSEYEEASLNLPRQALHESANSSTQPQANTTLRASHRIVSISEMSSLSSGFGDGDIIMPPADKTAGVAVTQVTVPRAVAQRTSVSDASSQRRETVCTEASEDPVPRFRTVNSWVLQQSGRVKRAAKQREEPASDAPPVPSLPLEQDFGLMMPDDEEPRRVEETEVEVR